MKGSSPLNYLQPLYGTHSGDDHNYCFSAYFNVFFAIMVYTMASQVCVQYLICAGGRGTREILRGGQVDGGRGERIESRRHSVV